MILSNKILQYWNRGGILMADFDLLEYIKRVYGLEALLYQQRFLKRKLNNRLKEVNNVSLQKTKPLISVPFDKDAFMKSTINGCMLLGVGLGILGFIFIYYIVSGPFWAGIASFILSFIVAGIFGYVMYVFQLSQSKRAILEAERKNFFIASENRKIEENNQRKIQIAKNISSQINRELAIIQYNISQTEQALEQYYSMDIIYSKYRKKLVAISSFYEYLSSRRCYSLEGPDGAYNIFETEIRLNIIIQKLDEAIRKLDQIKENQYMLYSAIQDSNNTTTRLYKKIDEASRTMKRIEENTSISEYNTRIAAQNTEFLKWVEFFK